MLDRINGYKIQKAAEQEEKARREQDEREAIRASILGLKDEVERILEIANAAKDAGISLDEFTSNGLSHKLGFIDRSSGQKKRRIEHVGIIAGGACGSIDFWVGREPNGSGFDATGVAPYCLVRYDAEPDVVKKDAPTWLMRRFPDDWNEFQASFYGYIDRTCGRQPEDERSSKNAEEEQDDSWRAKYPELARVYEIQCSESMTVLYFRGGKRAVIDRSLTDMLMEPLKKKLGAKTAEELLMDVLGEISEAVEEANA